VRAERAGAADEAILRHAVAEDRVIITQDTDFGTLLAASHATSPSVILLRLSNVRSAYQAKVLLENIAAIEEDLEHGSIVVISESSIRIRKQEQAAVEPPIARDDT